ncbi:MAG: response regulator transcription factor [Actinomycetota bacterium]
MAIRVAVVDDTDHVRQMLVSMLELDGFDVVGEGASGSEAVDLASKERPDVMVLDYAMPEMDGLTAARKIRAAVPRQSIILYTAYLDERLRREAKDAGVALCVGKVEGLATLERNISEICLQLGLE